MGGVAKGKKRGRKRRKEGKGKSCLSCAKAFSNSKTEVWLSINVRPWFPTLQTSLGHTILLALECHSFHPWWAQTIVCLETQYGEP